MTTNTTSDTLRVLLFNSELVQPSDLNEAISIASQLGIAINSALVMSGVATEESLKPVVEADARVQSGRISLDLAIKALRLALKTGRSLDEAIKELTKVHKKTGVVVQLTNELTTLLLAAKIISAEQLGLAIKKSEDTRMLIGQVLLLEQYVSLVELAAALAALFLIRDAGLDKDKAVQGLRFASQRQISIEQALFELGFFTQPSALTLRLGELFEMATIISRAHLIECLEVEFFKQKQFGQILLEQGLITQEHLEAAVLLQTSVANESLQAYQAAEALRRMCTQGIPVYQAMAEVSSKFDPLVNELRLGELLVQAELCSKETIERILTENADDNIKVGKLLIAGGVLKESSLYAALRCQSLWKLGYLSGRNAIKALSYTHQNNMHIDEALQALQLSVPARMQWSWV